MRLNISLTEGVCPADRYPLVSPTSLNTMTTACADPSTRRPSCSFTNVLPVCQLRTLISAATLQIWDPSILPSTPMEAYPRTQPLLFPQLLASRNRSTT